jgi:D-alanine-D-alanine ligase
VVKPLQGSAGFGVHVVRERGQLAAAVRALAARYRQDVLVEEHVGGREISIGLLGNGEPDVLPFVEHDEAKTCPARFGPELGRDLREIALGAFRAIQCRDYARIDVRIDREGRAFVLGIDSMAALGVNAAYALAARTAGMSFPALVERILDAAHRRYFGVALATRQEPSAELARDDASRAGASLPH